MSSKFDDSSYKLLSADANQQVCPLSFFWNSKYYDKNDTQSYIFDLVPKSHPGIHNLALKI